MVAVAVVAAVRVSGCLVVQGQDRPKVLVQNDSAWLNVAPMKCEM